MLDIIVFSLRMVRQAVLHYGSLKGDYFFEERQCLSDCLMPIYERFCGYPFFDYSIIFKEGFKGGGITRSPSFLFACSLEGFLGSEAGSKFSDSDIFYIMTHMIAGDEVDDTQLAGMVGLLDVMIAERVSWKKTASGGN